MHPPRGTGDLHRLSPVVSAQTSVGDAHDICDRIEAALKEAIEGALITIHVEPEHKAKHNGVVVV